MTASFTSCGAKAVDGRRCSDALCRRGYVGVPSSATVRIKDNDSILTVTAGSPAAEPGTPGTFTAHRQGDVSEPLDVGFDVTGLAVQGSDYADFATPAFHFAPGASVTVTPIDDLYIEGDESVIVTLLPDPESYQLGDPHQATLLITDDDTFRSEQRGLDPR